MARGRRIVRGNPWAICRAAQKRHGFGRKKLERCILEVKKKAGLGHVSDRNLREVERIVTLRCMKAYNNAPRMTNQEREIAEDACVLGAKNALNVIAAREGYRDE